MNIKKHIPNFLTCCNLLCGCIGILLVSQMQLTVAAYFIFLACVFDFFDGFAARALKVSSPIGKDLDSLADMVTFGVLPGFIMFQLMGGFYYIGIYVDSVEMIPDFVDNELSWRLFGSSIALIIPIFSALRLAKFNNDDRQSDKFIGLPTPANALFIASLGMLIENNKLLDSFIHPIVDNTPNSLFFIFIPLTILLSYLLVAELPLIALKFKNFSWLDNKMRYLLIISSIILLIILNIAAIPIIIILYIILSLIENKLMSPKINL